MSLFQIEIENLFYLFEKHAVDIFKFFRHVCMYRALAYAEHCGARAQSRIVFHYILSFSYDSQIAAVPHDPPLAFSLYTVFRADNDYAPNGYPDLFLHIDLRSYLHTRPLSPIV